MLRIGSVVSLYGGFGSEAPPSSRHASVPADAFAGMVFEPEDLPCLLQAMDEAMAFLLDFGPVGPGKRRHLALAILKCARGGMRDPHRLAVKGVVGVV